MALPSRWYGTTFNVLYSNEPLLKTPIKAHLITSRDGFELISSDWKTSIQKFSPADVERIEPKKTIAVLTMKPGQKMTTISLNTKPDPCDSIVAALTPGAASSPAKPDLKYLAPRLILPHFKASERIGQLQAAIVDQTSQLLQLFGAAANAPFSDVFACLLRMRQPNDQVSQADRAVASTICDLKRWLIVTWCAGIVRCLQPAESPTQEHFFIKLAHFSAETIAKACRGVQISSDDLIQAVGHFPDGVEAAVQRISREAQDAIDREAARVVPFDKPGLKLVYNMALEALAGAVVGMYASDCEALSSKVVDYTAAVATKERTEDARGDLIQMQTAFLKATLCLLDGRRYEEPFQWIYCVWGFRNDGGVDQP
jgi:hypothetical protein